MKKRFQYQLLWGAPVPSAKGVYRRLKWPGTSDQSDGTSTHFTREHCRSATEASCTGGTLDLFKREVCT
jgi:hypothetical protein